MISPSRRNTRSTSCGITEPPWSTFCFTGSKITTKNNKKAQLLLHKRTSVCIFRGCCRDVPMYVKQNDKPKDCITESYSHPRKTLRPNCLHYLAAIWAFISVSYLHVALSAYSKGTSFHLQIKVLQRLGLETSSTCASVGDSGAGLEWLTNQSRIYRKVAIKAFRRAGR